MGDKLLNMSEAIARYVPDGSSVAIGLALEPLIPFAAGHELIRQQGPGSHADRPDLRYSLR